jgi:hypothetical protein
VRQHVTLEDVIIKVLPSIFKLLSRLIFLNYV